MKIVIDARTAYQNQAGIGRYTSNLLKALAQIDFQNEYFLLSDSNFSSNLNNQHFHFVKCPKGLFWQIKCIRKPLSKPFDLYFSPSSLIVPALAKFPTIVTIHDLSAIKFPNFHNIKTRFLENFFLTKALKKAQKIIVPSEFTKKEISQNLPVSESKISVIPHGIDSLLFYPQKNNSKLKQTLENCSLTNWEIKPNTYYLFVSTLEPRKNLNTLLLAYSRYKQANGKKKLLLIGKKGWKFNNIFQLHQKLNLNQDVFFLSNVSSENLPIFYSEAFALIYPSLYEGFGFPPLEAMACGCPVIVSNTSSLPEAVNNAGILTNPQDENSILEAMLNLERNPSLRNKFIAKGLLHVKKFNWQETAKKTLTLFNNYL